MANDTDAQSRTPEEVQNEIGQTRAELDDTLGEIGRRLSPEELKHQAVDYVKETAWRSVDIARQHPETVALAGMALAAAFIVRHNERVWLRRQQAAQVEPTWERVAAALSNRADEVSQASAPLSEAIAKVAEMANRARHDVVDVVGDVASRAQRSLATEPVARIAAPAKQLITSIEESTQEHSLLSLAIATGVGAVLWSLCRR